jgi:hypothetical protein
VPPGSARQDAEQVSEFRASGRAVKAEDRRICAVLAGQELSGSLVLTGRRALEDADRRLFERASVVTALRLALRLHLLTQ